MELSEYFIKVKQISAIQKFQSIQMKLQTTEICNFFNKYSSTIGQVLAS